MIKKLLKNDIKENLKIFSDIKIPIEYSNLSKELSIQHHNFTFSSFYNNLKNREERSRKGNTFSLLSFSPYPKNKKEKRKFDIDKMRIAIEKMKEEAETNEKRKNNPYTERKRDSLSYSIYGLLKNKKKIMEEIKKRREKEKKIISPGLGRYNPKYNSIEKHTQRVIFSFKNFKTFNTAYNQKLKIEKRKEKEEDKKLKSKIENIKKRLKRRDYRFKKKVKENLKLKGKKEKIITKTEQNDIPNLFQNTEIYKKSRNNWNDLYQINNKNNHCFKFETYTSRKPLLIQTSYTDNDNIFKKSPSIQNIKGNISFNKDKKSLSRNYLEEIIKNKKHIPSIGFYRPNYSYVTPKTIDIYFNGKKDLKKNIKYFKLKKILGNYNVTGDYELFQFLNSKNNKIKNGFI